MPKDNEDTLSILNLGTADPFCPDWLTGLVLWLRADHFEDPYLAPSNGDPVILWTDSSESAAHAYQTNSSKAPVYRTNSINGLPCLEFDRATGRYMTGSLGNLTSPCSIFLVVEWDADVDQGADNDCALTIGGGGFAFQTVTMNRAGDNAFFPDTPYHYLYINPVAGYAGTYLPGDEWIIQSAVHDSEDPRHWSSQNGIYRSTQDYSSGYPSDDEYSNLINTNGDYCIGAYKKTGFDPNTFFGGRLAEVIVFDRALPIDEHEAIIFYLSIKYGLDLIEPVSPDVPSSLRAHYSADSIGNIADGDIVSIWPDQSTLGNDLIRQTEDPYTWPGIEDPDPYEEQWRRGPFYRENSINGQPSVQFSFVSEDHPVFGTAPVTGDWMEAALGELVAPFTIFMIARWGSIPDTEATASFNNAMKIGSGINPEGAIITISKFFLGFGVFIIFNNKYACAIGNNQAITASGFDIDEWVACTSVHLPDVHRRNTFYVNSKALLVSKYDTNVETDGRLSIGRGLVEYFSIELMSFFRGSIAEIVIFDRQMNKIEKSSVEQYLMNKYDLPETAGDEQEPYLPE